MSLQATSNTGVMVLQCSWTECAVELIWELKQYIRYYLEHDEERIRIAKSGYDVAMSKHRSWQIMERIILEDWTKYNWGEFSEGYPINQVVR